jgi:prepilin-type N-terminal cleavage/methylation domain-containing protein
MKKNKGFTLIELLVVLAIIGVLMSIVLISLKSTKSKSKDSVVVSYLSTMKVESEIYYNSQSNSVYSGLCTTPQEDKGFGGTDGPGMLKLIKDSNSIIYSINVDLNNAGGYNTITCHDKSNAWAVEVPMSISTSASPKMYCIDSLNSTPKETTSLLVAGDTDC